MEIKRVALEKLVEDPHNARTHPEKNMSAITESLRQFGQVEPIVVRKKSNVVIGGNGRLVAMRALGWKHADVHYVDVDDATATKIGLALNRTAELAEWDADKLGELLASVAGTDDLAGMVDATQDLLAFDLDELSDLLPREVAPVVEDVFEIGERERKIVREWAGEVARAFEKGVFHPSENEARFAFCKAQSGAEYPRFLSHAFHPQQIATASDAGSIVALLDKVASGTIPADRLLFLLSQRLDARALFRIGLPAAGHKAPLDFPAQLAREVIDEFASGSVLDPCHGWGGRLVGFLLSRATRYVGVDASPLQSRGVSRMREVFVPLCEREVSIDLLCEPFERFKTKERFSLVFTSPPYFDVEKYVGGEQSHEAASFEVWVDSFFDPLVRNASELLQSGGHLVLQVGSQTYPLAQTARTLAERAGLSFVVERVTDIVDERTARDGVGEVLLVWQKR